MPHDLDAVLDRLRKLHPRMIDLSLGRMERLLAKLGHPERRLPPVFHIAGTNGKGSVTAYLKAMLEAAGKRVHVYTSPHLVRFNERISVPGPDDRSVPIGDDALARVLVRVEEVNAGDPITFFEVTTAAAFLAFAEQPADAVLLEVGLGGRLDATNVIAKPLVTVVTSISMDHADKLGDTVAKIAGEKAGIIKSGVPAVSARQVDEVEAVLERRVQEVGAPLLSFGRDFEAFIQRGRLVFQRGDQLMDLPKPALIGPHQVINAGVAIAAILQAPSLDVDETAIGRGLVTVSWPARMQRLGSGPLPSLLRAGSELWLDGGHNPAGGEALAQTLADLEERLPRPLWLVCGMMGHKDVAGFLGPFRGLAQRLICVPVPGSHEAPMAPEQLCATAKELGLDAETADDVEAALRKIKAATKVPVRVVICGSLYLAGPVLALQDGAAAQKN